MLGISRFRALFSIQPDRPHWADAAWRIVAGGLVGVALVAGVAAIVLPFAQFQPIYARSSIIFPLLPFLATVVAWRRLRAADAGSAWSWVTVGVSGFYLYEALWYIGWHEQAPMVYQIADITSLCFSPLILVGLLKSSTDPASPRQWRRALDATILTLGSASLGYAVVVLSGTAIRPIGDWHDALLVASPVIDLVTLCGLALLWGRSSGMPAWTAGIGGALLLGLVGDVWFALSASIGRPSPWFVRAVWYGYWAMIGIGATQAMRPNTPLVPTGRIARLPYLITLACYVALALAVALDLRDAIVSMTASVGVLTVLVLARQLLSLRDITDMEADRVRMQADTRLAALVRHGGDMLMIVDPDLRIIYASPSHQAILGVPAERLVGERLAVSIHPDDLAEAEGGIDRLLSGSPREALVFRLKDAAGRWRWIEAVGTNQLDEPSIGGLVLNGRDISDRKQLEVQLLEQALRDPLTGLANRRLFGDRVSHGLARRHRRPDSMAVLLLDLDHFKVVNDSLGHAKGDALLIAVAERLRNVLRNADTVARLGGDEFAVLLEDLVSTDEAEATATRIQVALSHPFMLDGREVTVRASIGIAWATEGQGVDDLLTDADVAMYGAKNAGRGCIERFSSAMRATVAERHHVEADLRRALERNEFEVLYQPVVDLKNGRISGAEALVRWRHPTKGEVLPARFIPVAEESGLIIAIGRFVLNRAALDAARFRGVTPDSARMRVAINLSGRQLLSADLVHDVVLATEAAGITGSALAVELTESVLAAEGVIGGRLQALRDLGIRIALDDFGTGYSALAYLRHFPIDVLKVDKSFVSWVRDDGVKDGVTKAIISMGQSLSMRTVAEGIETRAQLDWLRSLGCSLGQGYFFSLPLPADQFVELLQQWDASEFAAPPALRERISRPAMPALPSPSPTESGRP